MYVSFSANRLGRWMLAAVLGLAVGAHAQSWRFVTFDDTRGEFNESTPGVDMNVLNQMADAVVKDAPDLVVVPGDLISGHYPGLGGKWTNVVCDLKPEYDNWKAAMAPIYKAGIRVLAVRGNHELYGDPDAKQWFENMGKDMPMDGAKDEKGFNWSLEHKNALLIGLDQYLPSEDPQGNRPKVDEAWFDARLTANTQPHVFVFGHTLAFKVNSDHTDLYAEPNTAARDTFWDALQQHGGRVYFCGHVHSYYSSRISRAGFPDSYQIVNGCGGAAESPTAPYGTGATPQKKKSYRHEPAQGLWDVGILNHFRNCYGYTLVQVDGNVVTLQYKAVPMEKIGSAPFVALETITYTNPVVSLKGSTTP